MFCVSDATPKTQCSKEKVCVSGSTKCGNSVCSAAEKCVRADSCKVDPEKIKAAVKAGGMLNTHHNVLHKFRSNGCINTIQRVSIDWGFLIEVFFHVDRDGIRFLFNPECWVCKARESKQSST